MNHIGASDKLESPAAPSRYSCTLRSSQSRHDTHYANVKCTKQWWIVSCQDGCHWIPSYHKSNLIYIAGLLFRSYLAMKLICLMQFECGWIECVMYNIARKVSQHCQHFQSITKVSKTRVQTALKWPIPRLDMRLLNWNVCKNARVTSVQALTVTMMTFPSLTN